MKFQQQQQILLSCLYGFITQTICTKPVTVLNFDDITPANPVPIPIFDPPASYRGLHLTGWSVFQPRSPDLAFIIAPEDTNCAVSAPNALLGARNRDGSGPTPGFEVAPPLKTTSIAERHHKVKHRASEAAFERHEDIINPLGPRDISVGSYNEDSDHISTTTDSQASFKPPTFDLVSMTLKPLVAPPGHEEITMWVRGFVEGMDPLSTRTNDSLTWFVAFPTGWHSPFTASFPAPWHHLRQVQIWAEYGSQKLDWEFCIDDVRLKWHGTEEDEETVQWEL